MARPVKASNGTAAERHARPVVPSCWTIAPRGNLLRSNHRMSRKWKFATKLTEAGISPIFAASFLAETYPLQKGRYLRRWARRLRELTFAPEDAIVVAYGSFGIDGRILSIEVETIVTNDLKLATHFHARYAEIVHRFHDMIAQLPAPYAALTLPAVVTTA